MGIKMFVDDVGGVLNCADVVVVERRGWEGEGEGYGWTWICYLVLGQGRGGRQWGGMEESVYDC